MFIKFTRKKKTGGESCTGRLQDTCKLDFLVMQLNLQCLSNVIFILPLGLLKSFGSLCALKSEISSSM